MLKTSDSDSFGDDEDEDAAARDAHGQYDSQDPAKTNIFRSRGSGVPLRQKAGYDYPPTWLKSNSQLQSSPPSMQMSSMSMHIIDQGYGANALLSVRQIDHEDQKKFTLEQQSRAGVLGRIVSGVWVKLAQVRITCAYLCIAMCVFVYLHR